MNRYRHICGMVARQTPLATPCDLTQDHQRVQRLAVCRRHQRQDLLHGNRSIQQVLAASVSHKTSGFGSAKVVGQATSNGALMVFTLPADPIASSGLATAASRADKFVQARVHPMAGKLQLRDKNHLLPAS